MTYSFKTDSEIVQGVYNNADNYLVEYDDRYKSEQTCAVYFCSNDIYFPDNAEIFRKRIIEKNFFEWYGTRFNVWKHIFVRDVFKQWYLKGINRKIDSTDALTEWIKEQTQGLRTYMVGSSAGGYAAVLFGSLTRANRVVAFNPQFEIASLADRSTEETNPLVFRKLKMQSGGGFLNIISFISAEVPIYYIYSNRSKWDIQQSEAVGHANSLHRIEFNSAHHGIPFLKVALPYMLNMSDDQLLRLSQRVQHPILFSLRTAGLCKCVKGLWQQIYNRYKRRR